MNQQGINRAVYGRRATAFTASLALLFLSEVPFMDAAMAQANPPPPRVAPRLPAGPSARMQAPIGHRQPRPQDLPSNVRRDEGRPIPGGSALDKSLEICRGC
jgi:hypothetical protein